MISRYRLARRGSFFRVEEYRGSYWLLGFGPKAWRHHGIPGCHFETRYQAVGYLEELRRFEQIPRWTAEPEEP